MDEVWHVLHHPAGQLGTGIGLGAGILLAMRGDARKMFFWLSALIFWFTATRMKMRGVL